MFYNAFGNTGELGTRTIEKLSGDCPLQRLEMTVGRCCHRLGSQIAIGTRESHRSREQIWQPTVRYKMRTITIIERSNSSWYGRTCGCGWLITVTLRIKEMRKYIKCILENMIKIETKQNSRSGEWKSGLSHHRGKPPWESPDEELLHRTWREWEIKFGFVEQQRLRLSM